MKVVAKMTIALKGAFYVDKGDPSLRREEAE
jgi:hypothetical protein